MARTCSGSFLRIRPMSRNTHVSWRPTARLSSAAQTELSTPPESASSTRPLPTFSRRASIVSCTNCGMDQSPSSLQTL